MQLTCFILENLLNLNVSKVIMSCLCYQTTEWCAVPEVKSNKARATREKPTENRIGITRVDTKWTTHHNVYFATEFDSLIQFESVESLMR